MIQFDLQTNCWKGILIVIGNSKFLVSGNKCACKYSNTTTITTTITTTNTTPSEDLPVDTTQHRFGRSMEPGTAVGVVDGVLSGFQGDHSEYF